MENFLKASLDWVVHGFLNPAMVFTKRKAHYTKDGIGKRSFRTYVDAKIEAEKLSTTHTKYAAYKCPYCDYYHFGPKR